MWHKVLAEVADVIGDSRDTHFFRGHSDAAWTLLPGLARQGFDVPDIRERVYYFDFVTRAGHLLPEDPTGWSHLFAMQHHGMPTRLLDWTESFGVALYFAMRSGTGDAAIWVLDPFALNAQSIGIIGILHPDELKGTYVKQYLHGEEAPEGKVVAMSPVRHYPRVFNQRAGFTLHDDLDVPLEVLYPQALHKIIIPAAARTEARMFLRLAGISEFSLFADLDGLARELLKEYQ
jgi:hypothetical protein